MTFFHEYLSDINLLMIIAALIIWAPCIAIITIVISGAHQVAPLAKKEKQA